VVELALALPEDVRRRGRTTKWVLREAMAGRLPEEIRGRLSKADMTAVLFLEMATQGGGILFRDLALADLGWVEGSLVAGLWERLEAGHRTGSGHPGAWDLWSILSTERWVRGMV
jgi:hypothetical protein